MKSHFYALPLALVLAGCGGGANLSGPNPDTKKGLGTLIVRVTTAEGGAVADGAAIVVLDRGTKVVLKSKAVFYNLQPKSYFVQARSQFNVFFGDGQNVDIKADKTLTITLKLAAETQN